jgi:STE24 endopeptidase
MNEDRASRYHRLRRRAAIVSTVLGGAALVALGGTGLSSDLAAWAAALSSSLSWPLRPVVAIALYVGVVALAWEVLSFPVVFYRTFLLDRKYGLSAEPPTTWLADHGKALALGLGLTLGSAIAVYATIRLSPHLWWLISTGLFVLLAVAISRMAPVWLMPLFYRFQPLEREALRQRLLALSQRAGVGVIGAFEWGLGEKTSRANAALVGAGRTRRIIVSDTLLKDYSDDEIEVILAHELAHHVHHDIWTALAVETLVMAAAFYAAHAAATYAPPSLGLRGPADLGAWPLMILAGGAVSLLLAPISNAWSRYNERRADAFAVRLSGRPAAFVSAMKRLGAQNLAEERPSRVAYWFFHTHPTMEQRIANARGCSD